MIGKGEENKEALMEELKEKLAQSLQEDGIAQEEDIQVSEDPDLEKESQQEYSNEHQSAIEAQDEYEQAYAAVSAAINSAINIANKAKEETKEKAGDIINDIILLTEGFNEKIADGLYDKTYELLDLMIKAKISDAYQVSTSAETDIDTLKVYSRNSLIEKVDRNKLLLDAEYTLLQDSEKRLKQHRKENSKTTIDVIKNGLKAVLDLFARMANKLNEKWGRQATDKVFEGTLHNILRDPTEHEKNKQIFKAELKRALKTYSKTPQKSEESKVDEKDTAPKKRQSIAEGANVSRVTPYDTSPVTDGHKGHTIDSPPKKDNNVPKRRQSITMVEKLHLDNKITPYDTSKLEKLNIKIPQSSGEERHNIIRPRSFSVGSKPYAGSQPLEKSPQVLSQAKSPDGHPLTKSSEKYSSGSTLGSTPSVQGDSSRKGSIDSMQSIVHGAGSDVERSIKHQTPKKASSPSATNPTEKTERRTGNVQELTAFWQARIKSDTPDPGIDKRKGRGG